jgi:DNA-binding beta-propeller fold protein YncE
VSPSDVDRNVRNLIYVIDSNENKVIDTIKVGSADHDFLRDVAVDSNSGMIYATGEYRVEESGVTYENDSIYFIDPKTKQADRISVYGEPEEGKEGDLSKIAVDPSLKLIYVGSLYPEGGMPGLYVVDPAKNDVKTMIDRWESGVSEVLVDPISHELIVTAKYDNLVSLINSSTSEISKNVSIVDPVATSWDPEGSIYVATGSGNISVIDPISGKANNHFVGSSVQDLSFDPKARMLYITSINKTVQLTPNSSEPIGKLMVMNPTTGVANVIFQSEAALTKTITNPSSGTVYTLGYDDKNSKLFILKPQLS